MEVLDLSYAAAPARLKYRDAVPAMLRNLAPELSIFIGIHEPDLIIVEGQNAKFETNAHPQDQIWLGQVAGGAAALALQQTSGAELYMPEASEWKGSVPKPIHQKRILEGLGWSPIKKTTTHSYPKKPPREDFDFTSGQWKHIVDAIGLALWGIKKYDYLKIKGGWDD